MTVSLLRATVAGLLTFGLLGLVLGQILWAVVPDEWSVDATNAAGFAALALYAAVGGLAGAWKRAAQASAAARRCSARCSVRCSARS